MPGDLGPPGGRDGEGGLSPEPADVEKVVTKPPNYSRQNSAPRRQCRAETHPWQRRREASWRLPPLHDGAHDPWRPYRPERVSPVQVQGAVDAARHLLAEGLPPIFDAATMTAIWRRGDRALAQELYELAGGDVA